VPDVAVPLPCRRAELVIRRLDDRGPFVVKDPGTGGYYQLGLEEHFLLTELDGHRDSGAIRAAFAERFAQTLSEEELQEFLDMAGRQGLLREERKGEWERRKGEGEIGRPKDDGGNSTKVIGDAPLGLRLLYWRRSFFDPDRFFNWLAPKIWWFWTPAFLVFSAGCICLATLVLWANRPELAQSLQSSLRWETAFFAWLVLMLVTTCHELAHGLTCKRYGGEVHEVGFLLIFFTPCFYCNVSDAWLLREKSKRLWVTLAGGYFELFFWSLTVFIWRVTVPDSLVNYLAFIVMTACGVQTLFNFNPLLKLDGYYLLSDWLEIPNLQERAGQYVKSRLRRLLWGAARPEPDERGRTLLTYGLVSWLYSLIFLALSLGFMTQFFGAKFGALGLIFVGFLGLMSVRGVLHGCTAGEVEMMIRLRHKRTAVWLLILGTVSTVLAVTRMEDRANGPFQIRPATRAELRAPLAGFIQAVYVDEGDRVSSGSLVARLEVPDLASRLAQKRAELDEAQAKLRLLEAGPRREEVVEQHRRVQRAQVWRDLAEQDLARGRQVLAAELASLDKLITQHQAEREFARDFLGRATKLRDQGAMAEVELRDAEKNLRISQAQMEQAQAQKRARQTRGTEVEEIELARRQKELADSQGTLALLEAGSRPEEIDAERARLTRLREETRYLEALQDRVRVCSTVAGAITTAHLKEKTGQYVREGDLICLAEEPAGLEVEITLAEQDVALLEPGQAVELKARALPFSTLSARVDRIAPSAGHGEVQSSITVHCRLENAPAELRPGMSGYARIYTGQRSIGQILVDRMLRYVRTEFWW
jgi:multidrug efflux pump subunit AcrA (membrane-fusion protein)